MSMNWTSKSAAPGFGRAPGRPATDRGPATVTRLPVAARATASGSASGSASGPESAPAAPTGSAGDGVVALPNRPKRPDTISEAKAKVQPESMERLDLAKAVRLPVEDLTWQVTELAGEILSELPITLNSSELCILVNRLIDDMVGLGPLEPLLADDSVTDILVNGPRQVYVEREGKLQPTEIVFQDDRHVLNVARRIASRVGRRIDESMPMVDARLEDGSRVNIIVPPLALKGPMISIRKFGSRRFTLRDLVEKGTMSPEMAALLRVACRSRANILISGGTGSGKTTLLNAISETIGPDERIITIEDAAELQLQQPHVGSLETRPANLEGDGRITARDLLRNALRMRPDRIILGEVRGDEVIDMLQAMNTGHEGSLGTVHANSPRDALVRLENLVAMSGLGLPLTAVRTQIASAIDLIVQISRMRDGSRRITRITEVTGIDSERILLQDLFALEITGEDARGKLTGRYETSEHSSPALRAKAAQHGHETALLRALAGQSNVTAA